METYANILLIAIPGFLGLMMLEIIYGFWEKKQTYSFMDTLSSLSSGITNLLKDVLGIGLALISYPFIFEHLHLMELSDGIVVYVISFICIDFASYWGHRLNHSINIFWNYHIIHHSSEEFNLACALRQSISNLIEFGALFLIPAALLGVPHQVIIVLAPLHLFGQFWYHTQHIGKLGWLEYVLVTPSQHRVHHAINPEYVDKNLSAIFCVWDRMFGTFQEEMDHVPCVYGTIKPVQSWNPLLINFQHLWGLITDAWHTKKWKDKLLLWWKPTGWRPADVTQKYPRSSVTDVFSQKKYAPNYALPLKVFAGFHFVAMNYFMLYFLATIGDLDTAQQMVFAGFILFGIFGYTAIMDGFRWALNFEIFRHSCSLLFLFRAYQNGVFLENYTFALTVLAYGVIGLVLTLWVAPTRPDRVKILA